MLCNICNKQVRKFKEVKIEEVNQFCKTEYSEFPSDTEILIENISLYEAQRLLKMIYSRGYDSTIERAISDQGEQCLNDH